MPYDGDFPEDCKDDPDHDGPCPDEDRDQPTLADCMADIDLEDMDDSNPANDLTPFFLDGAAHEVSVSGTRYSATLAGDGISFVVGGVTRTIEWGWRGTPSSKAPWNPQRVSFDGGAIVTIGPA